MNNDLNHNLVCRNGNTIKTTFHGARQREAVQQLTYEQRIQSCACMRGGGRRRARRERGFEWNAFRIMRHVRIPRVRLRGNEGNGEQVGSRVSPLEIRHERCADVCSEKCLVVAPPYQDKLILMPDTVVDVCTQAWISATDDYLSRDNGTMCARLVCCTMRKMYGFVARRGFVSSDFNEIGELLIAAALGWQLAIDNL